MKAVKMARFGTVLLTRDKGRAVAEALPKSGDVVRLSFSGVEAASPSFLDELAKSVFEQGVRSLVVSDVTKHIVRNLERVSSQRALVAFPRARVELSGV